MTSKHALYLLAASIFLAGCPGQEENATTEGLTLHVAEVHVEAQLSGGASAQIGSATTSAATIQAAATTGGYDHGNLEAHDVIDGAGHLVSLYRAYLVIDGIEPVKCTTLSELPRVLMNALIPTAQAHAGHGAEPVGGRSLDKANVIDIVTQDGYYLALGDLAVAPGTYCGVRLTLASLYGDGYGQPEAVAASTDDPTTVPEIPDLNGEMFAIRADYCAADDGAGNCLLRTKIDVDEYGTATPLAITLNFAQPIIIDAARHEFFAAIGIAYGEWFNGIDASLLPGDVDSRQLLLENIAASFHIHDRGYGELPPNIPGG